MEKKLVQIKRSEWSTPPDGKKLNSNALLIAEDQANPANPGCDCETCRAEVKPIEGRRCCLGFVGRAEGFTDDEMRGKNMPRNLPRILEGLTVDDGHGLSDLRNTDLTTRAANINDDHELSQATREAQLVELFATHELSRWTLEFID